MDVASSEAPRDSVQLRAPHAPYAIAYGAPTQTVLGCIAAREKQCDLDLFVLALIKSGVSTPYVLQKEAGLSPGATIPAIRRFLI
jgi:hypothetical protein